MCVWLLSAWRGGGGADHGLPDRGSLSAVAPDPPDPASSPHCQMHTGLRLGTSCCKKVAMGPQAVPEAGVHLEALEAEAEILQELQSRLDLTMSAMRCVPPPPPAPRGRPATPAG